jgi:hypothetical protein
VAGLVHAVENRTTPNILLLPVMTLWANVHGSFTFGLAIGAVLAAEAIWESRHDQRYRTALHWTLFLGAALCFACITPYGYRPLLMTFNVFVGNEALRFVQEWQPVAFKLMGINEWIIFALLFSALYYGAKLPLWRLILTLALLCLMLSHVRFAALFAITTPLLLASSLVAQFPFLRLTEQIKNEPQTFEIMSRFSRRLIVPASILIAGGVTAFGTYGPPMIPAANITPNRAVDYIHQQHLFGNVYNTPDFGGYLIFMGIKTFVDARNDQLFGGGFFTQLVNVIERHPRMFPTYLNDHRVDIALVRPDTTEARELERSSNWVKVYSDEVSELLTKRAL